MGYPTDEDFAEAHGWNPDRPSYREARRKRKKIVIRLRRARRKAKKKKRSLIIDIKPRFQIVVTDTMERKRYSFEGRSITLSTKRDVRAVFHDPMMPAQMVGGLHSWTLEVNE